MTNEEIIQRGILIRDETEPAQNTSERVGRGIEGIGRNLADKDTAIAAEAARNGYYQCTVNSNQLTVTAPGFTLPAHGGNIRIKMSAPATGACTLNINSTGPKELLYNGAAVSSANTWEQNEIISVFYDPSGSGQYLASNSQGGGGKFGSGEKVKDVGITDNVTVNDDNLVTSGGVYKDTPSNVPSTNDCDLDFADSLGNVLVSFEAGHVKTKEFDSTIDAPTKKGTAQFGDLELADPDGNVLVSFEGGHIKTKNFNSGDTQNNYWKGKKIIWNGHSGIYGSIVTDRTKIFPYLVNQALGASYVNYAIGGATLSKKPNSYEEMYLSTSEWQAAIAGGLVNTSKQYLVKDGETGSARPFGLYSYSNGSWSALPASQRTGTNTARTPLVDSISDMDTDADLVIIGIGANDWSNEWTELSSPYVNGVLNDDKETICGAMNIVCQYLSDTYIQNGKRVLFLTECPSFHYIEADNIVSPYSTKLNMTYRQFVDLLTEIAGNYGIPYWNLQEQVGLSSYDTWWVSDGDLAAGRKSHPNVAGHARVADILTKMLLNF